MRGELGIHGVPGDDGVEPRRAAFLGAQQPPQSLGLLLT